MTDLLVFCYDLSRAAWEKYIRDFLEAWFLLSGILAWMVLAIFLWRS